jgi:regulator of sigma E protease
VKFNDRILVREIIINNANKVTVERDGQKLDIPIDKKFVGILSKRDNKNKLLFGARAPFIASEFPKDSPAKNAGMQAGDRIIGFNNTPTPYFHEFVKLVRKQPNEDVMVTALRNDRDTLNFKIKTNENAQIGVGAKTLDHFFKFKRQEYTIAQAIPAGITKGLGFLADQAKAFGQMFKGRIKFSESIGGLGSIGGRFGAEWLWERFWLMTAILSLVLAFMNLLPIPALDGGHVLFLLYEMVSGRKPSDKFLEYATTVGFVLVLGLILFANGADIWYAIRDFFGK